MPRIPAVLALVFAAGILCGCQQSAAEAAQPGVERPAPSRTAGTGQPCGGIAGVACRKPGDFCRYAPEAQCGAADQMGTCAPKPEVCAEIYAPVCGCDGKTYGNSCQAEAAGVSVSQTGECPAT